MRLLSDVLEISFMMPQCNAFRRRLHCMTHALRWIPSRLWYWPTFWRNLGASMAWNSENRHNCLLTVKVIYNVVMIVEVHVGPIGWSKHAHMFDSTFTHYSRDYELSQITFNYASVYKRLHKNVLKHVLSFSEDLTDDQHFNLHDKKF